MLGDRAPGRSSPMITACVQALRQTLITCGRTRRRECAGQCTIRSSGLPARARRGWCGSRGCATKPTSGPRSHPCADLGQVRATRVRAGRGQSSTNSCSRPPPGGSASHAASHLLWWLVVLTRCPARVSADPKRAGAAAGFAAENRRAGETAARPISVSSSSIPFRQAPGTGGSPAPAAARRFTSSDSEIPVISRSHG